MGFNSYKDGLIDIRSVRIDRAKSVNERISDYIAAVGDPYCFRVGTMAVRVNFSEGGRTLTDTVAKLLKFTV